MRIVKVNCMAEAVIALFVPRECSKAANPVWVDWVNGAGCMKHPRTPFGTGEQKHHLRRPSFAATSIATPFLRG